MKRFLSSLIIPGAVLLGSLGMVSVANVGVAAAATAHVSTATKTWHGKVTKINETMGATHSFSFEGANMKLYVVHYDAMTKFTMGSRKDVKVGAIVSVKGTLKGMTVTATSIDF